MGAPHVTWGGDPSPYATWNNIFFIGKCKFSDQPINILNSTPYIDIPMVAYEDSNANNLEELFNNYIFINLKQYTKKINAQMKKIK